MNKNVNHGSFQELTALNTRGKEPHGPGVASMPGGLKRFNQIMEEYDPGAKRVHELAKKYH